MLKTPNFAALKQYRGILPKGNDNKSIFPEWVGLVALSMLCLAILFTLWVWQPWTPVKEKVANHTLASEPTSSQQQDYRFYDLLPQQQVTPIPQGNKSKIATTTTVSPDTDEHQIRQPQYILQIRTFEEADQADARRTEILLSGLSAEVILVEEKKRLWYRVISGPYDGEKNARQAQQILKNSGIDSILVKQNR